ncbi:MAG: hypothetical protein A2Y77_08890 [Planctomycetes bacterium RBG_13_62_9]|nr:MAG: hypothetical protein A2Y77_08890 [Planctomycetes bacterium RBG_13_62_9]
MIRVTGHQSRDTPEIIMANEIQADYASGNTLYAAIRDWLGQVWCVAEEVFEDWGEGDHTATDYGIALVDHLGSRHTGDFPENVPAGSYSIQVFLQAGAAPADSDTLLSSRQVLWTGEGELTTLKVLMNKAVQDKLTGAIAYYDDDGQTVLFTHMPEDTAAAVTRDIQFEV